MYVHVHIPELPAHRDNGFHGETEPLISSLQETLAESMNELTFLGSLLGMPSIFDPMFPTMYCSFFGSYPSWMQEGMDKESGETGDSTAPASPVLSNVSISDIHVGNGITLYTYAQKLFNSS